MSDEPQRIIVPPRTAARLRDLYLAHTIAQRETAAFQNAVALMLDIDPASVAGFDDEKGELVLRP